MEVVPRLCPKVPVWSKIRPSQFPDQNHRVDSHRHQPPTQTQRRQPQNLINIISALI